jgi:hypothetical protein
MPPQGFLGCISAEIMVFHGFLISAELICDIGSDINAAAWGAERWMQNQRIHNIGCRINGCRVFECKEI